MLVPLNFVPGRQGSFGLPQALTLALGINNNRVSRDRLIFRCQSPQFEIRCRRCHLTSSNVEISGTCHTGKGSDINC